MASGQCSVMIAHPDALSEIARIARDAIRARTALQRKNELAQAQILALKRELDKLIGNIEASHDVF